MAACCSRAAASSRLSVSTVCVCLAGDFFATGARGFDLDFPARFLVVEAIDKDRDTAEQSFMPLCDGRQGMLAPEQIQLGVKSNE